MDAVLTTVSLLGFLALTAGTALFVAAEFSLTALERSTVDNAVATYGDRRSRQVQHAHRSLSFQLSGAQLGITITTLITGYIAQPVLARLITPLLRDLSVSKSTADLIALVVALVLATSLSMVLGELVPKNVAISRPMATARGTAGPVALFSAVFRPVINGLNGSANGLVRKLGIEPTDELRSARSPNELGALVRNSAAQGALDAEMAVLVRRSLQFGELTAEDLMTPRVTIDSLERTDTVVDLIRASARTGHSRFPVVDGDLDNILGIVHVKQAFTVPAKVRATTTVASIARPITVVPDSLDGDAVMARVKSNGLQVAVVIDEYGGTAGIVTTEDAIEEIVGRVTDEHDTGETADIATDGDGFICSGLLRMDELDAEIGYRAPDGEYETLGGLLMAALGRIPTVGDCVELPQRQDNSEDDDSTTPSTPQRPEWSATVLQMDGRRVDTVRVAPIATGAGDE